MTRARHRHRRRRLIDLCCGAGGAALGYWRAGFEVVGVDIAPQPRYPFEFHQGDALTWPLGGYDVIHASPPCQAWSRITAWSGDRSSHPRLIEPIRARLAASGVPYVIENVPDARRDLQDPLMLCGSQFGLSVRSHRYFEIRPAVFDLMAPCHHRPGDASRDHGAKQTEARFRAELDCGWMTVYEARQAIPPAYTEWIGARLLAALEFQEVPA